MLSQINIFPIKSTQKISLSQAYVKSAGIDLDRRFMIALTDGSMITSRRYPQLLLITTTIESNGLLFNYPNKAPLSLSFG
ncbi:MULTISPECIES: MOSC N-terminal beta barrel domain-containing protein [unclassified Photobacterium]|uniref:MOSC N-terminal beta barrel domain-containing protein n=1 Tax=unclassified Photobacterium TaxID=2628852 RepID=UPI001EDD4222|nr:MULTISPECIES: MOSC N-terminal beta barrel domain-containing protein [unclassified Photobacterium]